MQWRYLYKIENGEFISMECGSHARLGLIYDGGYKEVASKEELARMEMWFNTHCKPAIAPVPSSTAVPESNYEYLG